MAKTKVALEITETSVRAVEVTPGKVPTLIAAGEVGLPPGVARDSEIIDRDAVAVALRRLWAEAGIRSRDVILGVGNRRILVREHSTQLRDPVQIRQALPFEVQDRLPVPVDQAVLDFVPTGQDEAGVHGLLVAAVSEHMEDLVAVLDAANLTASSIDLASFGLVRTLATLAAPGSTGMFIAIGEHTTHVVIATDGIPRFVRVIPIDLPAAVEMPAAPTAEPVPVEVPAAMPVTAAVEVPLSRGERRRRSTSTIEVQAPAPDPASIPLPPELQSALIDLVTRIRGTVSFYLDRPDTSRIDATWISGLHAEHPRLRAALSQVAGTEVTALTTSDVVKMRGQLALPPQASSRLVSTVSLLMGDSR